MFFAELERRMESERRIAKVPLRVLSPSASGFVGRVLFFLGFAAAVNLLLCKAVADYSAGRLLQGR